MTHGKIKWFNATKGFGFIESPGISEDIFFHFSALVMQGFKTIQEGEDVSFELTRTDKGLMATQVHQASADMDSEMPNAA